MALGLAELRGVWIGFVNLLLRLSSTAGLKVARGTVSEGIVLLGGL